MKCFILEIVISYLIAYDPMCHELYPVSVLQVQCHCLKMLKSCNGK